MEQTTANPEEITPIEEAAPVNYDLRLRDANATVKNYVIGSMAAALVPLPLFDLVALTGIQLKMIHSLANLYGQRFSEDLGKSFLSSLLGSILPTTAATTLASIAKVVPGLGTLAGMATVSLVGGAATYAVGKVFIQHFESGGTFLDFNPEAVREHFAKEFKEGQKVAADLNNQSTQTVG